MDAENNKKAKFNLERKFGGYRNFKMLDQIFKTLFISVEKGHIDAKVENADKVEASRIIIDLCSIIQKQLYHKINYKNYDKTNNNYKLEWEKRLLAYFQLNSSSIPKTIASINLERVKASLGGIDSSLGANLMAIVLTLDVQILENMGAKQPSIIDIVGNLLHHRGHGNKQVYLKLEELDIIISDAYNLFRFLERI